MSNSRGMITRVNGKATVASKQIQAFTKSLSGKDDSQFKHMRTRLLDEYPLEE